MKNVSFLIQQKNMKEFGPKLDQKLKELMVEKSFFMKKNYCKIDINAKDDFPLKESLTFLDLIININLILQTDNKLFPQIYLDECFYEL